MDGFPLKPQATFRKGVHFPPHKTNGHTISVYGRLFFLVTSNSRKDLAHLVDLEGGSFFDEKGHEHLWKSVCTCEAYKYGERPCRHIVSCFDAMAAWAGVDEDLREEWSDRCRFLLSMGRSFTEAIQSLSKSTVPEPVERTVRKYELPKR